MYLAQKTGWSLRGDAGTKACLFCQNLVAKKSKLDAKGLTFSSFKPGDIVLVTDASMQGANNRVKVRAATMSKRELTSVLCHLMKFCVKTSLVATGQHHHSIVAGGFAHRRMEGPWDTGGVGEGLASEILPTLFSNKKEDKASGGDNFRCTASEGLTLVTLLAIFIEVVVGPATLCT